MSPPDGVPDACDACPLVATTKTQNGNDGDGDGIPDVCDSCPGRANATQSDTDCDGVGDACEG